MNNYNSEWRIWAKVIAVIDLIGVVILMLTTLLMTFLSGAVTIAISESPKNEDLPQGADIAAFVLWFAVAILVIQTSVGLWAAVQLLKATELGREAMDAYKCCHYWQIVSFVAIVGSVISGCMLGNYTWMIVGVMVRIVFLFVVYRFMRELQAVYITTPRQMTEKV